MVNAMCEKPLNLKQQTGRPCFLWLADPNYMSAKSFALNHVVSRTVEENSAFEQSSVLCISVIYSRVWCCSNEALGSIGCCVWRDSEIERDRSGSSLSNL